MHNTKLLKSEHLTIYFLTHFVLEKTGMDFPFVLPSIMSFVKARKFVSYACMSTKVKGKIKKGVCYMKYLRPPKNLIYSGSK